MKLHFYETIKRRIMFMAHSSNLILKFKKNFTTIVIYLLLFTN